MLFIQILIVAFALLVIVRIVSSFKKRKISFKALMFWLALWTVMIVVVLLPQTTVLLANALGIWRGTDAAVYLSIVLIFYLLFKIFVKLEKIENDITTVVREIGLKDKK